MANTSWMDDGLSKISLWGGEMKDPGNEVALKPSYLYLFYPENISHTFIPCCFNTKTMQSHLDAIPRDPRN